MSNREKGMDLEMISIDEAWKKFDQIASKEGDPDYRLKLEELSNTEFLEMIATILYEKMGGFDQEAGQRAEKESIPEESSSDPKRFRLEAMLRAFVEEYWEAFQETEFAKRLASRLGKSIKESFGSKDVQISQDGSGKFEQSIMESLKTGIPTKFFSEKLISELNQLMRGEPKNFDAQIKSVKEGQVYDALFSLVEDLVLKAFLKTKFAETLAENLYRSVQEEEYEKLKLEAKKNNLSEPPDFRRIEETVSDIIDDYADYDLKEDDSSKEVSGRLELEVYMPLKTYAKVIEKLVEEMLDQDEVRKLGGKFSEIDKLTELDKNNVQEFGRQLKDYLALVRKAINESYNGDELQFRIDLLRKRLEMQKSK
ncbi:MAG: hypothetical protein GF347_01180 [Candidatus Moranbacteria bacterium]|nr:hypothetical protein [Candidatus Moranbacteria bacterium]